MQVRWITIACFTEVEWKALRDFLERMIVNGEATRAMSQAPAEPRVSRRKVPV